MDRHTHRAFERLEIVETGRRRRWSDEEKLKIVIESMAGPRLVSATARRYGISGSQLAVWRRTFQDEPDGSETVPTFVPAVLTPALEPLRQESAAATSRMEIILPEGRRVVVDADGNRREIALSRASRGRASQRIRRLFRLGIGGLAARQRQGLRRGGDGHRQDEQRQRKPRPCREPVEHRCGGQRMSLR